MKKLRILGNNCPKCRKLIENTEIAVREFGVEYEIEKVSDVDKIMNYGVIITPALAVDGEVKVVGILASVDGIKEIIK